MRRTALTGTLLVALVGVWQLLASTNVFDDLSLASPAETARSLHDDRRILWDNAWVTLREVLIGIAIALVVGVVWAVFIHLVRPVRDATYPLLVASQAIPIPLVAPLFVIAFDYGIGPKIAIVALVCFFPIVVNLADGLRATPPDLMKMMRSLGASRLTILRKVELPSALPQLFTGLKIAATISVIGAVFGEAAGAENGLGYLVLLDNHDLQTPRAYAGTVLLAVMGIALFGLTALTERIAVPWNRQGEVA
jgi:ABC-type nitrate/sulfonate/bicarbonate transport system permease component